jgi:hypothetical protein
MAKIYLKNAAPTSCCDERRNQTGIDELLHWSKTLISVLLEYGGYFGKILHRAIHIEEKRYRDFESWVKIRSSCGIDIGNFDNTGYFQPFYD